MIDFDIVVDIDSKPKKVKNEYNANDMKESEIERYKKDYNPLNPFTTESKVTLNVKDHERYSLVIGLTSEMEGSISELLGNNMVNIAYWDTRPSVIKNVPISSVTLTKNNHWKNRIRHIFINLLRKIIDPKKFPKKIEQELNLRWED